MNEHRQIRFLLKEAEMYLQFLNEDIDAVESVREKSTAELTDVLKEVTKKFREAPNIFPLKIKRESA
jgi:hypothetical protein